MSDDAYTEEDEMLDEVLRCDPELGGYDRRDDLYEASIADAGLAARGPGECKGCGTPTEQTFPDQHFGALPLCPSCWDTEVHGPMPCTGQHTDTGPRYCRCG